MSDWNAAVYHRLSDPQLSWGRRVLARLDLTGSELVADLGCGTGRLTRELAERLPHGRAIGIDRSASMLTQAAAYLAGAGVPLVRADAARLPFDEAFDVVFSTATFHWVKDHEALFTGIARALRPGGRLHAQCGGGANLAQLRARAGALLLRQDFTPFFAAAWTEPWHYAEPRATSVRLEAAGFVVADVWLEAAPVGFTSAGEFQAFVDAVCLRPYLERLPANHRAAFSAAIVQEAATDSPPFTLDYHRLNLTALKPLRPS